MFDAFIVKGLYVVEEEAVWCVHPEYEHRRSLLITVVNKRHNVSIYSLLIMISMMKIGSHLCFWIQIVSANRFERKIKVVVACFVRVSLS